MKTQKCLFFFLHFFTSPMYLLPATPVFEVSQQLGSHGTTAALQAFPFVIATRCASASGFLRVRVCACVSIIWTRHPEHNEEQFHNPHFLLISKASAQYSSGTIAAAAVQHQRTSQRSCTYIGTPVFSLSSCDTTAVPGFDVNHIRKGSLVSGMIF